VIVIKVRPFAMYQANMVERYIVTTMRKHAQVVMDARREKTLFRKGKKNAFLPLRAQIRIKRRQRHFRLGGYRKQHLYRQRLSHTRAWRWSCSFRQWIQETCVSPILLHHLQVNKVTFVNDNDFFLFRLTYPQVFSVL
jgi:hypothetical protein